MNEKRDKKTIHFSANGIGLGHVGRLKPFARWLHKEGHKVYFTGYGESLDQLKFDKFNVHRVPEITFLENSDGSFNSIKTALLTFSFSLVFMKQASLEYDYMAKNKPDLVVSDSRYSTLFAAKKYIQGSKPDLPLIFVTNQLKAILPSPNRGGFSWLEKGSSYLNVRMVCWADPVLIQDLPPPYTISTATYDPPDWLKDKFDYLGFINLKTPEELPDSKLLKEKFGVEADDRPLIYAPLAGTIVARKQLMELLKKNLKNFDGKIIISMGMFGKKLDQQFGNVRIISWLDDRFELLKAADITIARPGLATVGDFLRFGKPCLLIPTLNHPEQYQNAESIERLGVGKLLNQRNLNEKNLNKNIQFLINSENVKKSTKKMQNIMKKYNGMKKLKAIILEKLDL